ncbi:hypothetical protein CJI50_02295 [Bifidobacteriaceae bacterium NR021]|nr:hypothetical protein CJI50_02295 [Bifidobacteriaceae bacterium NR021]
MKLDAIVSAIFSLVIIAGVWCNFSPWFTGFPAYADAILEVRLSKRKNLSVLLLHIMMWKIREV